MRIAAGFLMGTSAHRPELSKCQVVRLDAEGHASLLVPSRELWPTATMILSVAISVSTGCSDSVPEGLIPLDGVLRWETGEELSGHQGMVRFHPYDPSRPRVETAAASGEEVIQGRVEADGHFKVYTTRGVDRSVREYRGLKPGQYKVLLFLLPGEGGLPVIHPDYNHPIRSPLLADITEGSANPLELTIERSLNGWTP